MTSFKPSRQLTCPHGRYWASCWCRAPAIARPDRHAWAIDTSGGRLTEAMQMFEAQTLAQTLALQAGSDQSTNLIGGHSRPQPKALP